MMVKCYAYFNEGYECVKEECQWYCKESAHCCMEMPREKWGTKEDKKFMKSIRDNYDKECHTKEKKG